MLVAIFLIIFLLNRTYSEMQEVSIEYASGALHPADVKSNLAKAINQILQVT
jgi:tyrosyl-tRNA synthetase